MEREREREALRYVKNKTVSVNLLIFYEVVAALSNWLHALEHDCWRLLFGSVRLGYFTLWVTIWIIIWLNHGVYVSKIIPISKCISLYIQCNVEGSILIASLEDDTTKGWLLDDKRLCPKFFLGNCVPHFSPFTERSQLFF